CEQRPGRRGRSAPDRADVVRRVYRIRRQSVDLRLVEEEEERAEPAHAVRVVAPVELRVLHALALQELEPLVGLRVQLVERAGLDRIRRAGLRARGLEPVLEAVVADRALVPAAVSPDPA